MLYNFYYKEEIKLEEEDFVDKYYHEEEYN